MRGLLIVVSGFSGVGKGTLTKELLKRFPEEYALSVSATSRKPRAGEEDVREYFFKTREEFEEMIDKGELVEYACYNGNYYGTPAAYVREQLEKGMNVILEIEVQGGMQIKKLYPDTMLLYVMPPSAEELVKRLTGRGTETPEQIHGRLTRAIDEAAYVTSYDTTLVNDDFETCLNEMHEVTLERQKEMNERRSFAEEIKNELVKITGREE